MNVCRVYEKEWRGIAMSSGIEGIPGVGAYTA